MASTTAPKGAVSPATVASGTPAETSRVRRSCGRRSASSEAIGKNPAMPPKDPESSGTDRDVLTSLPRTRPARRSAKRDRPAGAGARTTPGTGPAAAPAQRAPRKPAGTRARTAAKPRADAAPKATVPPAGYATQPAPSRRRGPDPFALVTTTVHAAAEIAQIGATLWGQAVRSAINRLPRP